MIVLLIILTILGSPVGFVLECIGHSSPPKKWYSRVLFEIVLLVVSVIISILSSVTVVIVLLGYIYYILRVKRGEILIYE